MRPPPLCSSDAQSTTAPSTASLRPSSSRRAGLASAFSSSSASQPSRPTPPTSTPSPPPSTAVPRPFVALLVSVIYDCLAPTGANSFSLVLENLLLFLSYWLVVYFGIVAAEHLLFRRGSFANCVPADYTDWRRLPLGVAGFVAIGMGWVGAVLGMSTSFFTGPLAKVGRGGDIGFELAFGLAVLAFVLLRYVEKKCWGY